MRLHQRGSAGVAKGIVLALVLIASGALIAFADGDSSSRLAAQQQPGIEASIFSFRGQDFVRIHTTLVTQDGKPAVGTTLDHDTPAYKALIQKRSYTGDVTLFGRRYEAYYAPLTGEDGGLTGALFVGVRR